jgi:hypothetical protein
MWGVRLGSYRQQYDYIYSRLARTSRPEIPRLRLHFKHVSRDAGNYVHQRLIDAFLNEYLEADGYFFIRILAANASDFIVQEIIEQLWTTYVMKYGELDAKRSEDAFYEFRQNSYSSQSSRQPPLRTLSAVERTADMTDGERKYLKQHSEMTVGLLKATSLFEPVSREQSQQV